MNYKQLEKQLQNILIKKHPYIDNIKIYNFNNPGGLSFRIDWENLGGTHKMIAKIKNKNVTFFNLENVQYNMDFYQLILNFAAQNDAEKMNLLKDAKINHQELNAISKIANQQNQLKVTDINAIKAFVDKNKDLFN